MSKFTPEQLREIDERIAQSMRLSLGDGEYVRAFENWSAQDLVPRYDRAERLRALAETARKAENAAKRERAYERKRSLFSRIFRRG